MEKIFNQKNFNNFVWSPLGSRGNIYINFCLQVHFQVTAAWYCSHYLPPVSTTPVANCHRYQQHRRQICHRCQRHRWQTMGLISGCRYLKVNLKVKINTYVNSTIQRCYNKIIKIFLIKDLFFSFATGVNDTGGLPWAANISENFQKKLKRP